MEYVNPYQAPENSPPADETHAANEGRAATFRSARPWGVAACLGIWLNGMLALVAAGLSFVLHSVYEVDDVGQIDAVFEQWLLDWINVSLVSMVAVRLVTAVPFMVWFYRAYANLLALGHRSLDWKTYMPAVCWFIPVFNLVAPCLIMRELRWRSDTRAEELGKANPSLQLVNLWWGAWIVGFVLSYVGNALKTSVSTLAGRVLAERCDIATFIVVIACAVLAMWLIVTIDSLQLRRHALQIAAGDPYSKPPPADEIT